MVNEKQANAKPKASSMPPANQEQGAELVAERNDFYRDGYRRMQVITMISAAASLAGVLIAGIAVFSKPDPRYFATDPQGKITPIVPLNKPLHTEGAVLGWAVDAVMQTLALDFVHYQRTLNHARVNFTDEGWDKFLTAMNDSGLGHAMKTNKQVLSLSPTDAPVVVAQGELRGVYTWKITQPYVLTFSTNTVTRSQKVKVNLTVVRVPTTDNPKGLGIQQFIMEDA